MTYPDDVGSVCYYFGKGTLSPLHVIIPALIRLIE